MNESVAVITPTLPSRKGLLRDAEESVAAQTVPVEHRVKADVGGEGPAAIRNQLAQQTSADWLLPLDDDDILYPDAVQVLLSRAGDADIVYPWCHVDEGLSVLVNKLWNRVALHRMNYIPVTALIRRDVFMMLGGYRRVPLEDWDLWRRAWLHGCRIKCVPEVLWHYRRHNTNTFQAAA